MRKVVTIDYILPRDCLACFLVLLAFLYMTCMRTRSMLDARLVRRCVSTRNSPYRIMSISAGIKHTADSIGSNHIASPVSSMANNSQTKQPRTEMDPNVFISSSKIPFSAIEKNMPTVQCTNSTSCSHHITCPIDTPHQRASRVVPYMDGCSVMLTTGCS